MSNLQPLPKRVQRAISRQHESSEVLLAWVQLAVVSLFALFYFIAPKTFAPDAEFKPVPWILAGYFAFTLLRLILAYRHRLPLWLTYFSGIVDVVLLLAMGFDSLSMSATRLPRMKWVVRSVTIERARRLLEEVMVMDNPVAIRAHLDASLEEFGLVGLIRAGK